MDLWAIKTFLFWNSWQLHFMCLLFFPPLFPAHHSHRGGLEAEYIHRIKMCFCCGNFLLLQKAWCDWEVCFFFLVNIIRANEDYKIIKIQISNISIQEK